MLVKPLGVMQIQNGGQRQVARHVVEPVSDARTGLTAISRGWLDMQDGDGRRTCSLTSKTFDEKADETIAIVQGSAVIL